MAGSFVDDVARPAAALARPGALTWFDGLTPERQKELSVFMIARMMAGTNDPVHLLRMNQVFNPYHFGDSTKGVLTPRKQDHMKLLAVAANHGRPVKFNWIKAPKKRAKNTIVECICEFYDCSARESAAYKIDEQTLIEMAEELGWDKDRIAKLTKEIQDGSGSTAKASVKPAKQGRAKRG